jgi:hypothetical protein
VRMGGSHGDVRTPRRMSDARLFGSNIKARYPRLEVIISQLTSLDKNLSLIIFIDISTPIS